MKLRLNWKSGLLSSLALAFIGIAFFILVVGNMDVACKNADQATVGCSVYLVIDSGITAYADIWRSIFAPECLGGNGPDSCLGPDGGIMLVTLLVLGFTIGNIIWPKKISSSTAG